MNANLRIKDIIYPELSYTLMGLLYGVHNLLGPNFQEKYYQKAIEAQLKQNNIPFQREMLVRLNIKGINLGRYFIDFVIDQRIALEVKRLDFFTRKEWHQVMAYLDAAKLKLGILVNFSKPKLVYKRILNPRVKLISDSQIRDDSQV
ncbi:GxxExxY protein [Candidatus Gottesmanbacteria bacterium]|nr:GxxExxY protein [Candidatus Gottesmanbacteria bacterium]